MACISFPDEDVRFAAIQTLQELAKHGSVQTDASIETVAPHKFQVVIESNAANILGLISDEDSRIRGAAVDFLSELAGQGGPVRQQSRGEYNYHCSAAFKSVINRNIPAIVTENFKSEPRSVRRSRLGALRKLMTSSKRES
jgi:HEAT repeat protein